MKRCWLFTLSCLLLSCNESAESGPKETIRGRYVNTPIYAYENALHWKRVEPDSIDDTKVAICEFFIEDADGNVRIAFHNFPSNSIRDRIPALAQIQRWRQQLIGAVDPIVEKDSWAGFTGYRFEGTGVMGWAMQMGSEHYYALADNTIPEYKEMRADFTIKATGSDKLLKKYRLQIIDFANSFELINDIPNP